MNNLSYMANAMADDPGPLSLTWNNFNLNMDK